MSVHTEPRSSRAVRARTAARDLSVPFPKLPSRLTTLRPLVSPSFLSGIASAIQLMPTVPVRLPVAPHRDLVAMQRQVQRMGEDFRRAMEAFALRVPSDLPQQERLFSVEDYDEKLA